MRLHEPLPLVMEFDMKNTASWLTITLVSLVLCACAAVDAGSGGAGEMEIRSGKIEQITMTQMQTNHDSGVGAILGGLAGVGIGSLIGSGTGRDVAMVAGALAGAAGGNYAAASPADYRAHQKRRAGVGDPADQCRSEQRPECLYRRHRQ